MEAIRPIDKREEINRRNRKKRMRIVLISAVLVFAAVIGIMIYRIRTKEYAGYRVVAESFLYENLTGYLAAGDVFYAYGNDGAKAVTADGNLKWEMSYHLDNPALAYCREVAAVADIGGNSVYVVAENGIPYQYQTLYPIVKHAVARQGVTAVLLDNGTEDFIQLYDINGTLRVDINTKTKTDGIPVDIALSEDGKKLVTLYITFQGSEISSKVTFYNAGEVGKNYIGNVVGQKTFEGNCLVYDIGFLKEDYIYVLSEDGFSIYYMKEVPELVKEEKITNRILDLALTEDGIYVIEETPSGQKQMCYYPAEDGIASEILGHQVWGNVPEYETFMATTEEVIFFSPQSMQVYRKNQSLKYHGNFKDSLEAVYPIGGNRYFLVGDGKVQTIKLTSRKQKEGDGA